jgi:uncharacterized membrane protein YiaA
MRTSAIKEILLHLVQISFLAGLQVAWLFCAVDFIFSYALGDKISAWNMLPIYFAAIVLNVIAVHTLHLFLWRAIVNLVAVFFIFVVLPPFNLSLTLITSGAQLDGSGSGILLGLAIIMTAAIFWYQGFRLATTEVSFQQCLSEFQFGFLIFLIVFFSHALSGSDKNYFIPVIIFIVCGMVSLFLSRRERSAAAGGSSFLINAAGFACIILTVLCGLLLAVLFNPALAGKLYLAGKNVLAFILNLIGQILYFLANLLPKSETGPIPMTPPVQKTPDPAEIANIFRIPPAIRYWIQILVISLFCGMILAALWSVSRQIVESFRRRKNGIRADVHSLPGSYLKNIFALIKNAATALMKRGQWLYIRFQGRNNDSLTMKFIYGQILRWAAMDGYRQKVSQTPDELYPQLAFWLPDAAYELSFITNQFIKVRYGEVKLNKDTLQQAWKSYKKIKQRKRRLFFQRRRK